MKTKYLLLLGTLSITAITVHAQLVSKSFTILGGGGEKAHVDMWVNLNANTVVMDIDNSLAASNSALVGTITGIGFNTPFTVASQANDHPGSVNFGAKWTQGSAHNLATGVWSNDDYWTEVTPYTQGYTEDYGVMAPALDYGISYGEKATFSFTFTQDITTANVGNFFDKTKDIEFHWAGVGTKTEVASNCGADGSDNGGFNLSFSQGDLPPTPEPSTYGLMGVLGLMGLVAYRKWHNRKQLI